MKSVFILLLFIKLTANLSLSEIRILYKNASKNKELSLEFYKKLELTKSNKNPTIKGYKAAAIALKSKYIKGVKNKKKLFKEGAYILETEIKKHPKNIELRLIRLSIQENISKLLNYKQNIEKDSKFIIKNIKNIKDRKLLNYLKSFVSQSKSFSKAEKSVISEL